MTPVFTSFSHFLFNLIFSWLFWAHFYTVAYFIPSPLLPASVHLPFSPLPSLPIFTEPPALPPQLRFLFSPITSSWLNKHTGLRTICYWWAFACEQHMQRTKQTHQTKKNVTMFLHFYEMKFDLRDGEMCARTRTHTNTEYIMLIWPHTRTHTGGIMSHGLMSRERREV